MTATGNPALDAGEESFQDRELLASLRAGEDAAFGELFSRHADAVRRLARSIAADRSDVEDLTAEAFFRVLQAIRRGAGPVDNVRSYLLIVTRRVAWEWSERRRDVPVSDEILSHRAGQNPDTSGQAHERNLITRAFTSLPERWRSVLWKVEVEGERPAVVAPNFGLSPNATAALARRARRGLRAAYLQAHLSTHHGSTGCRSILEKLGAYTAGTIKGAERRRVRAHLVSCSSCQSTHDELQDVCAGLRSYAGLMVAPVAIGGLLANKTGFWATLKGLVSSAGAKLTLAGSSVLAAGVVGLTVAPDLADNALPASLDFPGQGTELVITDSHQPEMTPATGSLSSSLNSTPTSRPQQQPQPIENLPDSRRDHDDEVAVALPADPPPLPNVEHHETRLVLRDSGGTAKNGNQGVSTTDPEGSSVLVGPPTCAETPTEKTLTSDKTSTSETAKETKESDSASTDTPAESTAATKTTETTETSEPQPADKPTR
ncbi:RNA polymerase sigma factor (sigma-70 family) [Kibdelosporangium banguiense]|uniref:RNA polymerase sigma factor (Sigma-70 family) n=1 Tax=Kibdelosporangium banguiense TaxID=1365924 RepID=A0ABS4TBI3_9PSEU|nr:sigma-70 family RNA polymerase sigma factor [Kibdelosporangium banguiense]MBP2321762.1 RNA polymerase sigma factor (sigma-70 family) [Kibdelosporangium banguiense]